MPLDDLTTYHSALLARSIRINPPKNTATMLTEIPMPPGPTTRLQLQPEQLVIPKYKQFKLTKQCSTKIPEIWNNLPYETKLTTNNTFKNHLKKFLYNKHNYQAQNPV